MVFRDTFDFESSASSSRSEAIRLCSTVIGSQRNPNTAAHELWHDLRMIASELRTLGGAITTGDLVQKLKAKHRLVESYHDRGRWEKIRQISMVAKDAVSPIVPTGQQVPRNELIINILALAETNQLLAIVGESGLGKAVWLT